MLLWLSLLGILLLINAITLMTLCWTSLRHTEWQGVITFVVGLANIGCSLVLLFLPHFYKGTI